MVATASQEILVSAQKGTSKPFTIEDFIVNPLPDMEWVDGALVEKTGMTVKHGIIQGRFVRYWGDYAASHDPGGEASPEMPCRTLQQVRRPDVAYLSPSVLIQSQELKVAPQSYPLIAEICSPTDYAEELFAKAIEYLESGCEEVWLVFPEAKLIMIKTIEQPWQVFSSGQTIATQKVLQGFSIAVDQVFA